MNSTPMSSIANASVAAAYADLAAHFPRFADVIVVEKDGYGGVVSELHLETLGPA